MMVIVLFVVLQGVAVPVSWHDSISSCMDRLQQVRSMDGYSAENIWCQPSVLPREKPDQWQQ